MAAVSRRVMRVKEVDSVFFSTISTSGKYRKGVMILKINGLSRRSWNMAARNVINTRDKVRLLASLGLAVIDAARMPREKKRSIRRRRESVSFRSSDWYGTESPMNSKLRMEVR